MTRNWKLARPVAFVPVVGLVVNAVLFFKHHPDQAALDFYVTNCVIAYASTMALGTALRLLPS